jgi:hypothetical protein
LFSPQGSRFKAYSGSVLAQAGYDFLGLWNSAGLYVGDPFFPEKFQNFGQRTLNVAHTDNFLPWIKTYPTSNGGSKVTGSDLEALDYLSKAMNFSVQ